MPRSASSHRLTGRRHLEFGRRVPLGQHADQRQPSPGCRHQPDRLGHESVRRRPERWPKAVARVCSLARTAQFGGAKAGLGGADVVSGNVHLHLAREDGPELGQIVGRGSVDGAADVDRNDLGLVPQILR